MLNSISNELNLRIFELKKMINALEASSNINSIDEVKNANKGLIMVGIYSVMEYTVVNTVSQAIGIINNENVKYNQLNERFKGIALQSRLQAYSDCSITKKWDKTWEITETWNSEEIVSISNSLLPSDGSNIKSKQLQSIWKSFGIDLEDVNYFNMISLLLNELTDSRNAISHGRLKASDVGRRFTFEELRRKVDEIQRISNFVVESFSTFLIEKKYLK
ncbi:hypothetical protein PVOR_15229 [Paenibacillus vortex V453]|uniref:RiboL-PSP-HEPN domain-containing protein n=1 Tax=Paenibacillus vortex V453 TaxID=715225 RepID=A0A2R9SUG8_9BACL|nr:MAE_28990/MAE_18760 family HEPN-like nuclease [Paenibacillus vortex]EFU40997.1 hypothetical protein PVOR_15229 [Paenibacillus vortex V453]